MKLGQCGVREEHRLTWRECREASRARRALRLTSLLRPGLTQQKRKAPQFTFRVDIEDADERQSRRERLILREGLGRIVPLCIIHFDPLPIEQLPGTHLRQESVGDGRLTHLTDMEGIPEKWIIAAKRRTTAGRPFTPVEGILERDLPPPPPRRSPSPPPIRISRLSDIEGIPERFSMYAASTEESPLTRLEGIGSTNDTHTIPHSLQEAPTAQSRIAAESPKSPGLAQRSPTNTYRTPLRTETDRPPSMDIQSSLRSIHHLSLDDSMESEPLPSLSIPPEIVPEEEATSSACRPRFHAPEIIPRSSLLGSEVGTQWVDGRRRSTRNRCKPLRWWDGEHKVYGRQYNTLATVTGYVIKNPKPDWPCPSHKISRTKRRQ